MRKWIALCALALSVMVCNMNVPTPAASGIDTASTIVAAASASAVVVEATLTSVSTSEAGVVHEMGSVSGKLSYPADSLPGMRVAAFDVATGKVLYIDTLPGQPTYSLALPAGTYHIVAYSIEGGSFPGGIAGGYTQAVLCGMAPECANHTLVDVVVSTGSSLTEINPADFQLGDTSPFPPMP